MFLLQTIWTQIRLLSELLISSAYVLRSPILQNNMDPGQTALREQSGLGS